LKEVTHLYSACQKIQASTVPDCNTHKALPHQCCGLPQRHTVLSLQYRIEASLNAIKAQHVKTVDFPQDTQDHLAQPLAHFAQAARNKATGQGVAEVANHATLIT
jgi:hypothetical protein